MSTIVVEHISKQFPGESRPAVDDCNMRVESGELVVLLGHSGSGKTTLMKMINRLYEPTSGSICIDGAEIHELSATALRRRIGYVIQQTGLFPHMRVADNIAVVPRLLKWDPPRIEARIDELLELMNLPQAYRKRYPRQLSGGEQQRVGIARALAADPGIVLMDEPFSAIDAITRARLQDELLLIQQRLKKTILFVTHDVDEALRLADRIVVMRQGKIVQFDAPLTLLTHPVDEQVHQLLGGDDLLRQLSLVRVSRAMQLNDDVIAGAPTIEADDSLRNALSLLLASGVPALNVVRAGQQLGTLSFDQIRSVLKPVESQTLREV